MVAFDGASNIRRNASPFFAQAGPRGGTSPETPLVASPRASLLASANHARTDAFAAKAARTHRSRSARISAVLGAAGSARRTSFISGASTAPRAASSSRVATASVPASDGAVLAAGEGVPRAGLSPAVRCVGPAHDASTTKHETTARVAREGVTRALGRRASLACRPRRSPPSPCGTSPGTRRRAR